MSANINVNLNTNQLLQADASKAGQNTVASQGKSRNLNIAGATLTQTPENPLDAKRKEAREKAYNIVKDAWDSDSSIDESIQSRKDRYQEMSTARQEAESQVDSLKKQQEDLKAEYTSESDPEYISRSIELEKQMAKFSADAQDADHEMKDAVGDIHAIGIERLKSHGMVDADNAADDLMAAASLEIIGEAMADAKENIDDKMAEEQEKAQEKAEAEKEKQENNSPELDVRDIIEQATEKNSNQEVSKSLDDIKNSMNLLEADLKGIKVDEEV